MTADAAQAFPKSPAPRLAPYLLGALPLAALVAFSSVRRGAPTLSAATYLPIHTAVELAVASMGIATFFVQWFAAGPGGFREARARFLGAAFLAAAVFESIHFLAFPGMPGFLCESSVERGIRYWLAARIWTVGALVAARWIVPALERGWLARGRLLALNLAAVAAVIAADQLAGARPFFFAPGAGLTPLKLGLEGAVLVAAVIGAALHASDARRTGDVGARRLAAALVTTAFAEGCFMLYQHPYDLYNVLGHAYLALSTGFVFAGLFVAALLRPYQALAALQAHVEGELQVTITKLQRSRAAREDLLRAVSHDLRNPLQVVLLQAQRLARLLGPDAPARRAQGTLLAASRRMERMLRDLTDSGRMDNGQLALERRPVELRGAVFQLLQDMEGALDGRRVENAIPSDLPPALADPDRLDRILANLVGNALKYAPGTVTVSAESDGGTIRVDVADRGPGISPDDRARLFERYYRGERHEGEGLRLGLYIVKQLVEAHGGEVRVESAPAAGSTFSFTLPAAV
jgi:signal transduction histidine kinase